jgi:peptidoglycan hydrolase-like protein with peptidoglycan-binding domain
LLAEGTTLAAPVAMNRRHLSIGAALFLFAGAVSAGDALSDMHPEDAYPNPDPAAAAPASPGPFTDLFKQVQEKLNALGFDAGPANGQFDSKTQAALTQFQLSWPLPASGSLDEATLRALGVQG